MVGNDDRLVVVGFGCFDDLLHAVVDSPYCLGDGVIDTCVTHHVTVGEVHHDEVVLVLVDGCHQFVLYLEGTHFRFQVVGSYLGRRNEDAVLTLEGSLATTIEEEGDMCVFLCLSSMQLFLSLFAEILAEGILNILFGEEDVNTLEVGIVGSHTVVLQSWDGMHTLLRHILLGQCDGHLLGAVVAEVDENDDIALLDTTVHTAVVDRFDKLVGNSIFITLLHGLHHIGRLLAGAVDDEVVALFDTLPTLVAVHRIETAYDRGDGSIIVSTYLRYLLNETFTRVRVGIATVHIAVYEHLVLQTVGLANLDELEQMVEAGVNTTVGAKSHQV